jgi:antitoxin (DNA-binding transcriptional repressor) of toxin-antitoxin stability system
MWAICSDILYMASLGIRELKDNLSRYIRRIEAGECVASTAHGRVVAELVPPETGRQEGESNSLRRARDRRRDPSTARVWRSEGGLADIRLATGTAAELIDADR